MEIKLGIIDNIRWIKTFLHLNYSILSFLEAWHCHSTRRIHHFYQHENLILMLSYSFKSLEKVLSEFLEVIRFWPIKYFDVLGEQFERTVSLQFHSFTRHVRKEESKINMENFSSFMEQNISIMPVFCL